MQGYDELIRKLDAFIRKYYTNKIIRYALLLTSLAATTFLLTNTLEYFLFLSPTLKKTLLIAVALVLGYYLAMLLFYASKRYKLTKGLSIEQAAEIIGKHFQQIDDKLINTLDLQKQLKLEPNNELLMASIDQKTEAIKPIPILSAINFAENKKYLRVLVPSLSAIIILLFAAPNFVREGTQRMIKFNQKFQPPAPFEFKLVNQQSKLQQGETLQIELQLVGEEIPQEVKLIQGTRSYKMRQLNTTTFAYEIENVQQSMNFLFEAGAYQSDNFAVQVVPKPNLQSINVSLQYPAYLKRSPETIENVGDLQVPEGTRIQWNIKTKNTSSLFFKIGEALKSADASDNSYKVNHTAKISSLYHISPFNENGLASDTLHYRLDVLIDAFPRIAMQSAIDSTTKSNIYFDVSIADDYGLTALYFCYIIENEAAVNRIPIPIQKNQNNQVAYYNWELSNLPRGKNFNYYFEVYDNDGVNGPKKSSTEIKLYQLPSEKALEKERIENVEKMLAKLEENRRKSEELQKEAKKITEKLLDQKTLRFEEKKQIQDLIKKQQSIEQSMEEIKEDLKKQNDLEDAYKNMDASIMEKRKQLEELFENVLDEKTKELMRELEKLLQQNNKELSQNQLQKMQDQNQNLEKEMDRMLELFKQLEFDKKLTEKIDALEKLSKEQKELSDKSQDKKENRENLLKAQEELNKKAEELKKDLQDLQKENQALEEPNDFQSPEEEMKDIEQDMKEGKEELQKKNNSKASEKQKSAAEKMEQLSQKMKQEQMQAQAEELDINIKALRQILDNLLTSSFNQEKVMEELKRTSTNSPRYVQLTQSQKNISDDMQKVEDSLFALSKKVVQIKSFINKEIGQINNNIDKSIEALAERRTPEATVRQQYTMTSMNNLAVLLSEILQQMQNEMESKKQNGKPGAKPGKKPGPKSGGASLSKMQEQLNKQMEEMKKGQNPGGGKDGKQGQGKMSEQLAKMAAQQQAIRNALSQLEKEMNKNGEGGTGNQINQLKKEMEKTEKDLYNKNLNQETIDRQKEIMSRLLEAEDALKEREYDEKRQAQQSITTKAKSQQKFEQYKRERSTEVELLKTVPPNFKPYYKEKAQQYFKQNP